MGYVTQLIKPPINYIIIVIVIGIMIVKHMSNNKKENELTLPDSSETDREDSDQLPGIEKMEKDSEYSEHVESSKVVKEEKTDLDEAPKPDEAAAPEGRKEEIIPSKFKPPASPPPFTS